jgi:hypothetical protein
MGELGELIAIALIESVGILAGAAGSNAESGEAALPGPLFYVLAEAKADLAIAMAVFHYESADESVRFGLEMMLDGYLDPAYDFLCQAGYKGSLVLCASWK